MWKETNRRLRENKSNYAKVRIVKNGIRVEPNSVVHYCKINAYLKRKYIESDHRLERSLKMVVKGILQEIDEKVVKEDLG